MSFHAVNEGGVFNVYNRSDMGLENGGQIIGQIYSGECFIALSTQLGYVNVREIRFLNSSGSFAGGFVDEVDVARSGNLAFYGVKTSVSNIGSCYRFKLRRSLPVVNNNGIIVQSLVAGDYVYTKDAVAGATNPRNMKIVGYRRNGKDTVYNGFVTLNYNGGSMLGSNFCLYPA